MGLILPDIIGILTMLTPLAVLGLGLTMLDVFLTHLQRKELVPMDVLNLAILALTIFVACGRFVVFPLERLEPLLSIN